MKTSLQVGAIVCALSVSGCSTIQSWFPDKEKDYQFTTELPPLVIPSDLIQKPSAPAKVVVSEPFKNELPKQNVAKIAKTVKPVLDEKKAVESVKPVVEMPVESVNRPAIKEAETELSRNEIQVSLTHETMPTLNLNVPSARAFRILGKALSRQNIEVTKRDQKSGQIFIQIADSKPKTESEKSFLDDTISVFDGFVSNEQSYVLKFNETGSKTAVTVLNSESQPLTDGTDNQILTVLFDAIKADLSK